MDESHRLSGDSNAGSGRPIVNTHIHLPPNFSAFDTAEQAVQMGAAEGVAAIGTANYHDFRVYARFAAAAAEAGIMPLFGLEIITLIDDLPDGGMLINDPTNLNRMYLCGKALTRLDPFTPAAARRMDAMRAASEDRLRRMTALIAARFEQVGLDGAMTDVQIAASVAQRCGVPIEWVSLQERHVAQAFQELLFRVVEPDRRAAVLGRLFDAPTDVDATAASPVQEAIRSNLMKAGKPAFVPEAVVSFDDAYRLILELGGIPCYPILADGASPICPFEYPPEALPERLLSRGIHCAELIPVRNRSEVVDRYVAALRGAGIVVMAGTEHNTRRMIPMEPTALGGEPLSELSREAFWEGTCVVAGHQQLCASGRPGYVDGAGRPTAGFADGEARIRSFRRVGADLITTRSTARTQA
ncbi:MAG: hypothetical protein ABSD62_06210 [Candidatus Limnocylindrales bacterium]|jgi:hypothetical protein